jgi:hypothetical protein
MAARQLSPLRWDDKGTAHLFDVQLASGVTLSLVDVEGARFAPDQDLHAQAEALGGFAGAIFALHAQKQQKGAPFDVIHAHDAGAGLALLRLKARCASAWKRIAAILCARRATR